MNKKKYDNTVNGKKKLLLNRYEKNPILTPEDMPFPCYTVMNAGAVRFCGKYILLLRVEDLARKTWTYKAESDDGYAFNVCTEPINYPFRNIEKKYDAQRFDMRITCIDGKYYVCHASWLGDLGCTIAIAETQDFVNFTPIGRNSLPSNRNGVLFPDKINGLYARLERPEAAQNNGIIWVSYSPDLIYWGDSKPIETPKSSWSNIKVGAGCAPIKTSKGWLEIYHGVAYTCSSNNYYLGVILLDLNDPSIVLSAPKQFILAAEKDYECIGQTPNVVFTGGAIETDDGKLNIYYGAADTRMCLAQTTIADLLDFCQIQ